MTNKKLGLLLAPLLPLTAIGIVEVGGALASMNEPATVEVVKVHHARPAVRDVAPTHFAKPATPPPVTISVPPEAMRDG